MSELSSSWQTIKGRQQTVKGREQRAYGRQHKAESRKERVYLEGLVQLDVGALVQLQPQPQLQPAFHPRMEP
jgi:hypothetical protein